jgi:hypothetical protein
MARFLNTLTLFLVLTSTAGADDKAKARPDEVKNRATVFSLGKLSAVPPADIAKLLPDKLTHAFVDDGRSLLIYADEYTTKDVEQLLHRMESLFYRTPTLVQLPKFDPAEIAAKLRVLFPEELKASFVPIRGQEALIIYANETTAKEVMESLRVICKIKIEPTKLASPEPAKYSMQFKNRPWNEVLKWYGEVSGLKMVGTDSPKVTISILPPKDRKFTLGEITDLINEMLDGKDILIRDEKAFSIVSVKEKVDTSLVTRIEPHELLERGKTELVEVEMFFSTKEEAKEYAGGINKLLTPLGSVTATRGKSILILDTAGNIRRLAAACTTSEGECIDPRFNLKQKKSADSSKAGEQTMSFTMKDVTWASLLNWYAEKSGLIPVDHKLPKGTFTYIPPAPRDKYHIANITDLINEKLAEQKLVLVRQNMTVTVKSIEENQKNPRRIEPSELGFCGKTELVQVLIRLDEWDAKKFESELSRLVSPGGSITGVAKPSLLVLSDRADVVSRILNLIGDICKSHDGNAIFVCRYKKADYVAKELKHRLASPHLVIYLTDLNRGPPLAFGMGSWPRTENVTLTAETSCNKVHICGPSEKIDLATKLVKEIDKPGYISPILDPILDKYRVPKGQVDVFVRFILGGYPSVKVLPLRSTDEILVLATGEEHSKIASAIGWPHREQGAVTLICRSVPTGRANDVAKALMQEYPNLLIHAQPECNCIIVKLPVADLE